jgi:hypothetical protein
MKTYVVRVYRPDGEVVDPPELRGVVDEVSSGASAAFHDGDELLRILSEQRERETSSEAGSR